MPAIAETTQRLARIPHLTLIEGAILSNYTRFGIGGPALIYAETPDQKSFIEALTIARQSQSPYVVIGGGTNLIVADSGFPGTVLRFTGAAIRRSGSTVFVEAGAVLQDLVDFSIGEGLQGIETMTGIPGSVGAAVYGNAGAYGHSIMERVRTVRFFDGGQIQTFTNAECEFQYRESIFKRHKNWIIFSTDLELDPAPVEQLQTVANGILKVRNEKYPPTMRCAGSIFKNLILSELAPAVQQIVPETVIREGKVPSAYFLEQVGAKGMRNGDIHVADYHANLIYNTGRGTALELTQLIQDLKGRVRDRFGLDLEEEVQYVGFGQTSLPG